MGTESKLKVGIVGFGMSAKVFHAPLIASSDRFEFAGVVERRSNVAEGMYQGVKTFRSLEEMCQDKSIDVVVITTPSRMHYENCVQVLNANKHCIVEKPFTVTSKEAYALDKLAKESGNLLSVYHNRRWDGDFLTVKDIVHQGLVGDIVEYEAHFDRFRPTIKNAWREQNMPGSGILYDLGSHLLDQAVELFGRPDGITADVGIQRAGAQVDDFFDVELHYSSKLRVRLKAGMLVREEGPIVVLHGSKGSFVKYGRDPQEDALKSGETPSSLGSEWGKTAESSWGTINTDVGTLHFKGKLETLAGRYQSYYENIAESIEKSSQLLEVTGDQAAFVILLIELALQSSRERKRVDIPNITI
mmetsp:Transcript_31826/g.50802  ORF Transcript_31826/g.50802 Transcript_31826/m.50802 type:complete len:359 (-) Transcript_31826:1712-2788(-)